MFGWALASMWMKADLVSCLCAEKWNMDSSHAQRWLHQCVYSKCSRVSVWEIPDWDICMRALHRWLTYVVRNVFGCIRLDAKVNSYEYVQWAQGVWRVSLYQYSRHWSKRSGHAVTHWQPLLLSALAVGHPLQPLGKPPHPCHGVSVFLPRPALAARQARYNSVSWDTGTALWVLAQQEAERDCGRNEEGTLERVQPNWVYWNPWPGRPQLRAPSPTETRSTPSQ